MAAVFREVYCAVPSANPASQEIAMVNVIASISIKAGRISEYLAILKDSMQAVRKEKGCIEYIAGSFNYREKTKNMVERVSLKVLQEAA